eukprot:CAMPEP_0115219720 /NCGR_PEP_ID=MMETSP0270-20121206/27070_1 /TAXON_ID=71861 /ORGANISM="Scrippsiella trochoidea, Strain CCMP3099" /LENGTH=242 /DNA_ID=CAMNT_0002633739 /DNA_START=39 /DNA_END=767 /DNA_ORIENTATION=-
MGFVSKLTLFATLCLPASAFIAPAAQPSSPALRASGIAVDAEEGSATAGKSPRFGAAAGVASGLAAAASLLALRRRRSPSKTAARYTTQVILPALQWIKTGLKASDLQATELKAKNLAGVDVLVGKDGSGKLFCVGNLCPHIGTPMSEGADVIGDVIVCPLHGSSFKVTTGELIDWCPSPPIIGPLTGLPIEKKNLAVFDVRSSFFGGDIEVLVDTNAKKAWEADYWKGILDAQGKDDGTYY